MHSTPHSSFGDRLRRYRVAAGLSQEALAECAGVSARTIGAIEQGTSTAPYKGTVERLADALAIPAVERAAFMAVSRYRRPRSSLAVLTPPWTGPSTLPAPPTALIGRDEAVVAVTALLHDPHGRLLTLNGAGGAGKTLLALHAAARAAAAFPDGVFFIPLAAIADHELVLSTIAHGVGLAAASDETGGR